MSFVITQSMYFPWVGFLEQVRLADVVVHYDDVQFTRGFYNRVQVKTPQGPRWMSVPLRDHHQGQRIDEALVDDRIDWRSQHRNLLRQHYSRAPFYEEMMNLIDEVFNQHVDTLAQIARYSILSLCNYFGLSAGVRFVDSSKIGITGRSTNRLRDIVKYLDASVYITGHGARNYLDHNLFEASGIEVRYMQYRCLAYPQLHGAFTPYVSSLDLVANCGRDGSLFIQSEAIHWKKFIHGSK